MLPKPSLNKIGKGNIGIGQIASNKTVLATNSTKKVVAVKKPKALALPLHSKQMAALKKVKAPASKAAIKPVAPAKAAAVKPAAAGATPAAAPTDKKANLKAKMQALLAGVKKTKAAAAA